ncbi:hypothetical protein RSAG8_12801, partial [Rhizoctonia solani AG-8 WAC10335]
MSQYSGGSEPAGLTFGSIPQQVADNEQQLGDMDPQSSQLDIYQPLSPKGGAPHLPVNYAATGASRQPSPSSRPVTPTLGQFEHADTHWDDGLHGYQFNALDSPPIPHLEPPATSSGVQPLPNLRPPISFCPVVPPARLPTPARLPASQPYTFVVQSQALTHSDPNTPRNTQSSSGYRYMHGPLQAERLEQHDEQVQKQEAAKEAKRVLAEQRAAAKEAKEATARAERERKVADKAVKEAERAKREAAAKAERERKAAIKLAKEEAARVAKEAKEEAARVAKETAEREKAAKEAKAKEAKAAKEAEKLAREAAKEAKGKGKAQGGRRSAGDSDTEIEAVGANVAGADIKPIEMKTSNKKWSPQEGIAAAKYIASKWATFKLKQTHVFRTISSDVLLGSKTETQVTNWWASQWKKYKACLRREVHMGGGDGDELDQDASHDNEDDNDSEGDSDVEIISDEAQAPTPAGAIDRTGLTKFTEAQLDAFKASDIYKIISKVANGDPEAIKAVTWYLLSPDFITPSANGDPEAIKAEEFDSARAFSDSEAGVPGPSKSKSSHSTEDSEVEGMLQETIGMVKMATTTISESRKAAADAAIKREEKEVRIATEEASHHKRQLDIEEEKRLDQQRHNDRQHKLLS